MSRNQDIATPRHSLTTQVYLVYIPYRYTHLCYCDTLLYNYMRS